jgi:ABC-type transporter Mla subunit MlaD
VELDRSTRKELARLAREAQDLWEEQRDVLSHARKVARQASNSGADLARKEVLPRAYDTYRDSIQPTLAKLPWSQVAKAPVKKSSNPFVFVLMAIGTIAVAVIGYAAWQTLRADDDLWVEEEA